jgi:Conjugative transposon protein TcpC
MAAGDDAVPGARVPSERAHSRQRRGAGGRWLVWALRAVVWAALLVVGYRGVAAIVSGPPKASPVATAPVSSPASGFPTSLAAAYALQFGAVYLNYSPAAAAQRASELAAFLPPGTDPQLGWNGAGSEQLQSEQVASISVQDSHRAVVTLLTLISGHQMELGVPIYSADGGLVVSGEPALLPAPARVTPPQPQAAAGDPATQTALQAQLPAFFQAFASGDQTTLGRFLANGAQVTGLGGAVTFGSISQMVVPAGGTTRHITVTVLWHVSGTASPPAAKSSRVSSAPAGVEMTYEMTVVQQGGSWYVQAIGASTQAPGPP